MKYDKICLNYAINISQRHGNDLDIPQVLPIL
jgi:hypothetical protein